jgi:hypothetical protein
LLAEAAVLPEMPNGPFFRFTPQAAQSRFDSICGGSFFSLMVRTVFLFCRAVKTDIPRPGFGRGSRIVCRPDVLEADFEVLGNLICGFFRFMNASLFTTEGFLYEKQLFIII